MDIYFVRHGQTGGNIGKRHQRDDARLTPTGRKQAQAAATYITSLQPTHLYVSRRVRAVETGQMIAVATDLMPQTTEMVSELCRPERIYGYKHRSLVSILYLWQWLRGYCGDDECTKNGESYEAIRGRIADMQAELAQLPEDARVVIVSHAVYINLFLVHMCRPQALSFIKAAWCFKNILRIKNGSVTHVTYQKTEKKVCAWQVQSFNKHKHVTT